MQRNKNVKKKLSYGFSIFTNDRHDKHFCVCMGFKAWFFYHLPTLDDALSVVIREENSEIYS